MSGNHAVLDLSMCLHQVGPKFIHEEEFEVWIHMVGDLLVHGGLDDRCTKEVMQDTIGMLVSV